MNFFWKYLAGKIAPFITPEIEDQIQTVAYRATDAQLAVDALSEHLGYTVVVQGDTGTAEIHGVKK